MKNMSFTSPKIITINGRFLTQPVIGVQRYANELLRAWDTMLAEGEINPQQYRFDVVIPSNTELVSPFRMIPFLRIGYLKGNPWEQIEVPWFTHGKFLFNPCNSAPILKNGQAVTIHDASTFAVPQSYSRLFRIKYYLILSIISRTANVILTVSQFSKNELVKYLHLQPHKIHVIPLGCDHILRASSDQTVFTKHGIPDRPYLLAVGSNAFHKNFSLLHQAITHIPTGEVNMIIAGGDFKRSFNATSNANLPGFLRIGYVSDPELRALYQNALGFVFPSFYEGFGIPPLEAMACGCPVIASNAASLPEVCGDAALYFNPHNPQDLADKIHLLANDKPLQQQLREKGIQRSKRFQWRQTALDTLNRLFEK
jgi:glycosyltransferase involved in cell wall biosynthesis